MHYFKTVLVYCSYILKIAHILFKIFGHTIHSAYRPCWAHGYVCRLLAVTLRFPRGYSYPQVGNNKLKESRIILQPIFDSCFLPFPLKLLSLWEADANTESGGMRFCDICQREGEIAGWSWGSCLTVVQALLAPNVAPKQDCLLELIPIRWKWP